jgi:hypothetical protein
VSDHSCSMYVREEVTYLFPEGCTIDGRCVLCEPLVAAADPYLLLSRRSTMTSPLNGL